MKYYDKCAIIVVRGNKYQMSAVQKSIKNEFTNYKAFIFGGK